MLNGVNSWLVVNNVMKIAITGPESTGKSWLAEKLASHYGWKLVTEYSRIYFEKREYDYDMTDLNKIAKVQYSLELEALKSEENIICDTDILAIKIWSDVEFGATSGYINDLLKKSEYDLVLLSNIDVPWVADRFRKNESDRQYIFSLFVNELEKLDSIYYVVEGLGDQRLKNAIEIINEHHDAG